MPANKTLLKDLNTDNKKLISRLISTVESNSANTKSILDLLHQKTGNAYRIGITGPPGAGKSSITNQLIKHYLNEGKTVGVIAVDPTSPFTGGALLGDRVRMSDIGKEKGVYIRSMATRGSIGGLSKKAIDAADVIDAAGFDYIIFETVGVGQSELDIAQAADSTAVVLVPESGDSIQAMKAGLMEIADFFIMNKCDRPGFETAITALRTILMFRDHDEHSWMPNIVEAVATENKGISDIVYEIKRHRTYLSDKGLLNSRREKRSKNRVVEIVRELINSELDKTILRTELKTSIPDVVSGKLSPYQLAENILKSYKSNLK